MKITVAIVLCCTALAAACGPRSAASRAADTPAAEAAVNTDGAADIPEAATAAANTPEGAADTTGAVDTAVDTAGPPLPEPEFPFRFTLKAAPPGMTVSFDGEVLGGQNAEGGTAVYVVEKRPETQGGGVVSFAAQGYREIRLQSGGIDALLKKGQLEIKLERENSAFEKIAELPTGVQPKSAYFSPDGRRIFVPLLGQHGVDVFRVEPDLSASVPRFERRLAVPGSGASGFVEAMIDEKRRELWVSNMEENRVHMYDLDTLAYTRGVSTGGVMPKVIVQSPDGETTAVSNWLSKNISVFNSDTKEVSALIPVSGIPRGMAFSDDGKFLYAAIYDGPLIDVIDMNAKKVVSSYRFHEGGGAARHVMYRSGMLYVSDMARGTVCILDAASGKPLEERRVGPNINTIVLTPDGKRIIASSRGRNNPEDYTRPGPEFGAVYVLSADDLSVEEKIWGRNQPTGLAVSPGGTMLVFTDFLDANLEVYRISRTRAGEFQ
ncbi:MAG: beta-propeller fold lactonase family protein [Treponema sp.]|nr:beta-propeller fold lactonase family protein [Treponema sp.]